MQEDIFVLDIGTRSVVAMLARMEKGELVISHLLFKEHKTRAMLDGQIHEVDKVAEVIAELAGEMRSLSGREIKKAAAAAAGRSLKIVRGSARTKYPVSMVISKDELTSLQLQAVQDAQMALPKNERNTPLSQQYYCVGYSIVEERLDGIKLTTLAGQKGQEAEVDVVATFLPRIIIESLQSSIELAGLELASITLEPIAVANLVLNPAMRRLNLVLVDIGAGTSDIAICGGDTISAFGMVPMAGDEVTEAVSDKYLLDFHRAEEVKRKLDQDDQIQTVDVLGVEQALSGNEVIQNVEPVVAYLAVAVAREINTLNNKPPQAVLLVGGGSLTPGLPQALAKALEIPEVRVVVQQAEKLQNIKNLPPEYTGPLFITVLGIAFTALNAPTMGFIDVTINDRTARLLNLSQNNVAEALLAGGYNLKEIYGRPGLAISCEIDGQIYTLPGKAGRAGRIQLNDKPAQFGDIIKAGDVIRFEPGAVGENGQGTFRAILPDAAGNCTVNGQKFALNPVIMVGDTALTLDEPVQDGCKGRLVTGRLIGDVLAQMELIDYKQIIRVNRKEISLAELARISKNGKKATLSDTVAPGDSVDCEVPQNLTAGDLLPADECAEAIEVFVNGKKVAIKGCQVWVNGTAAEPHTPVKVGDSVEYITGPKGYQPLLLDIFKEISFSPQPPPDKSKLLLLVNGQEKEYTYLLQNGDRIKLNWI